MKLARTERFDRAYQQLSPEDRKATQKAIRLLEADMRHPSLQVKRIQGAPDIWEARVNLRCRMTFRLDNETILLRTVGEHDATLKKP